MKSAKLVFFGSERLATGVSTTTPTVWGLIKNGYEVTAVVSHYSEGRSRYSRGLEIASVARVHKIPMHFESLGDIEQKLKQYGAAAAVLVAYGQIIPQTIIDIFPKGIINIHPSLLPKLRGPSPVEQAILDDERQTGVSLMKLEAKMDAGPVFVQHSVSLDGSETKQALADKLLVLGKDMLIEYLPGIFDGSLEPKPQSESQATYTHLINRGDGAVDWTKPAEQLEREVRAYAGWPKSQAKIFGHDVVVTKTRVANAKNDGDLVMQCGTRLPAGRQGYLEIQELTAPSGRTMTGADFMRGYKK